MSTRSRWLLWVMSVIVAFIVGYLLARRACPERITSSGGGGGASATTASQDSAAAAAGAAASAATGSGAAGGGGGPTSPNGDGGKKPGNAVVAPGAGGTSGAGGGSDGSAANASDSTGTGATSSTGSPTPRGSPGAVNSSSARVANTRAAPDFSLDATGLPRYPNSVTKVASTLTLHSDAPGDSTSMCVIVTSDSFDTVKQWYHSHLPADWHEQSAADLEQLAKQVSPENITKMLGAAQQGGKAPASSAPPSSRPSGAAQLSVATWSAPDNGTHSERQVMVKGVAGQPTRVEISRTVQP